MQQCGVALREVIDSKGGYIRPDGTPVPTSYERRWVVEGGSVASLDAARAKIEHAMTPPTRDQIEGWLAELSVITARRRDDDMTEALRLGAYASRLNDYPADVVRHALVVHRWKFFPPWIEVADVCDAEVARRKNLLAQIDRAEAQARETARRARALPDADSATLTPDEAAARRAEMRDEADRIIAGLSASLAAQQVAKAAADEKATSRMWASGTRAGSPEAIESAAE